MKRTTANRGSALMISLIVVILTAGIGGAFMAQALWHSNEQKRSIEADEAMAMCDAGMELARYAMGAYRAGPPAPSTPPAPPVVSAVTGVWKWGDMIAYCASRDTIAGNAGYTVGAALTPEANGGYLAADAKTLFKSPYFCNYFQWIDSNATNATKTNANASYNNYNGMPFPVPTNPRSYASGDSTRGVTSLNNPLTPAPPPPPIPIGNNIPFQRGAIHIRVDSAVGASGAEPDNAVVIVTATLQSGVQRQVQGVLYKAQVPPAPLQLAGGGAGLAAVVSNDVVDLTGSITIDGRDHQYSGTTAITAPPPLTATNSAGAYGIVSQSAMTAPKNGSVGGKGAAPPSPKGTAPGSLASSYGFNAANGYPSGYPMTPDAVLTTVQGTNANGQNSTTALPNGTLKAIAQQNGTYFADQTSYSNWLSAQSASGPLPGGQVLYLEFSPGNGMFDIGPGNVRSSIMVIHTDSQSGIAQEVHGNFTGLIIADGFVRNNGNSQITGMVQLLSPTSSFQGNVFGNGNAEIDFSSQALKDLPSTTLGNGSTSGLPTTPATLEAYRRFSK
jgi:hypothetical protein